MYTYLSNLFLIIQAWIGIISMNLGSERLRYHYLFQRSFTGYELLSVQRNWCAQNTSRANGSAYLKKLDLYPTLDYTASLARRWINPPARWSTSTMLYCCYLYLFGLHSTHHLAKLSKKESIFLRSIPTVRKQKITRHSSCRRGELFAEFQVFYNI